MSDRPGRFKAIRRFIDRLFCTRQHPLLKYPFILFLILTFISGFSRMELAAEMFLWAAALAAIYWDNLVRRSRGEREILPRAVNFAWFVLGISLALFAWQQYEVMRYDLLWDPDMKTVTASRDEMIELVQGLDFDSKTIAGDPLLLRPLKSKEYRIAYLLVQMGVSADRFGENGHSALSWADEKQNKKALRILTGKAPKNATSD